MGRNLIGIENHVAWATPGRYTVSNFPCAEDGSRCDKSQMMKTIYYEDPSTHFDTLKEVHYVST